MDNTDVDALEAAANTSPRQQRLNLLQLNGLRDIHVCAVCYHELMPHDLMDAICNVCWNAQGSSPLPTPSPSSD
jgi:hypothetical protein